MKILCLQNKPQFNDKESNKDVITSILREQEDVIETDVIVLPKFFATGFPSKQKEISEWMESIPGPTSEFIADLAYKYNSYVAGGTIVEKEGQNIYETCPIFGRDGSIIGKYRRMHIGTHHKALGMSDGLPEDMPVFKTDKAVVGVFIAYDCLFPEVPRILALKGAEVLFWLGAVDYKKIKVYNSMLVSHAFANSVYIVASNEAGTDNAGKYTFYGDSKIINPIGETVHAAGSCLKNSEKFQNCILSGNLNIEELKKERESEKSLWKQRRIETYSLISEKKGPYL